MIKTKITEMFGIKHPIASAAMGPFKTTDLCISVANAGGLGMLSHTNVSPAGIETDSAKAMKKNLDYAIERIPSGIFGFNVRTARLEVDANRVISEVSRHIPKLVAGGFANGSGLALALAAGADGISMGSRFIASKESEFHQNY